MYSDPKKAGSTLAILDGSQLQELSTPYSSFGSLSLGTAGPHFQASKDGTLPKSSHPSLLPVIPLASQESMTFELCSERDDTAMAPS